MRMRRTLVGAAALALALPGAAVAEEQIPSAAARACDQLCKLQKTLAGEVSTLSLVSDGRTRTARLYEPAGLSPTAPAPLLVMLHGGGGSGEHSAGVTGFDALAKERGFVVTYPDGWLRTWNARTCCGRAAAEDVDDVRFIEELVERIAAERAIDRDRVFVAGHSNGAMLAYRLACESDQFAAIAAVSAVLGDPCAPPRLPVSVLHIHGTADQNAPYEGGDGTDGFTATVHEAVRPIVAQWRVRDACATPTDVTTGVVRVESSDPCAAGSAVTLHTIAGGGHPWPGSARSGLPTGGEPSQALDASLVAWDFFAAHPRRDG